MKSSIDTKNHPISLEIRKINSEIHYHTHQVSKCENLTILEGFKIRVQHESVLF